MISEDKWNLLEEKLDSILQYQSYFSQKLLQIQDRLDRLSPSKLSKEEPLQVVQEEEILVPQIEQKAVISSEKELFTTEEKVTISDERESILPQEAIIIPTEEKIATAPQEEEITLSQEEVSPLQEVETKTPVLPPTNPKKEIKKSDWERFIGENLFNKIGIAIILIGVFIGVKYSIDHDLISPTMRIILGYLTGGVLFGVGYYLKSKYESFSAVLVSGAMAIFYFLTYVAYDFYQLFPTGVAFAGMFFVTVATVWLALKYNQQVIALIGMVGGYAVPFLLSNGQGHQAVLFSYVAIINIGILVISFYKQWRVLYHTAFFFTWLLYLTLYTVKYPEEQGMYFTFNLIFYLIFHFAFIGRKLWGKEKFIIGDLLILLSNTLVFYIVGVSFSFTTFFSSSQGYLTTFTLLNALFHAGISYYTWKRDYAKELKYLSLILALSFLTITIPIYFEGSWITLFWGIEAAGLFWIGRTKGLPMYERISYIVLSLGTLSLFKDWIENLQDINLHIAFYNVLFLNSLLYCMVIGVISYFNTKYREKSNEIFDYLVNILLVLAVYVTFLIEIYNYWEFKALILSENVEFYSVYVYDGIYNMERIWILIYTMNYLSVFTWIYLYFIRKETIAFHIMAFNLLLIVLFITQGLYLLSELRELYLTEDANIMYLIIRYIGLFSLANLVWSTYKLLQSNILKVKDTKLPELALHTLILWVASSEWLHWTDLFGSSSSYKLGLSILWVGYAVIMLVLGIKGQKKYLRVSSIAVIGFTLLKLFFYDIAHLSTISKVVVLVVLGILLMVSSFLYVKYSKRIASYEITEEKELLEEKETND